MDIRNIILERIEYPSGDFTAILPVYEAVNFIDEFVELDKVEYMEEGFEELCDIVSISLVNGEWYIEDAMYGDEVKYTESDVFFIDRDILEDIDMERLEGTIMIANFTTELEDIDSEILVNDGYEEYISTTIEKLNKDGSINKSKTVIYKDGITISNGTIKANEIIDECECSKYQCSYYQNGFESGYIHAFRMMRSAIDEILEEY